MMNKSVPSYLKHSVGFLLLLLPMISLAQIAQWRGPDRNGIYPDKGLAEGWPEGGPQLLMTIEGIGNGYSSAITNGKMIYVTGMKDSLDLLSAIDYTGKTVWQVPYGRSWTKTYPDSRSTPTLEANKVYVLSGTGRLSCFDATSGKEIWAVDVDKEYESQYGMYGVAESPLIVDDKVVCTPAGNKTTMVAFDKNTGKLIWKTRSIGGQRALASSIIYTYKNFRYILSQTTDDVFAVDPANGEIVWTYKYYRKEWEKGFGGKNATNTPIFKDNEIFVTKGYDFPAVMLQMAEDGKSVKEKWLNKTLDCHHHGVVLIDGYIYGSNWINNGKGNWVCLKWDTGELMYEEPWINKGAIIAADDKLFCYEEKTGTMALVKPNPKKFEVVSTFKPEKGSGMYWSHPMINDGKLFIRHGSFLMIYNIRK